MIKHCLRQQEEEAYRPHLRTQKNNKWAQRLHYLLIVGKNPKTLKMAQLTLAEIFLQAIDQMIASHKSRRKQN